MATRDDPQPTFDFIAGGPRRPRRPERLFFALLPNEAVAARIHGYGRRLIHQSRLVGKGLPPDRLHLSLHHVGDFARLRAGVLHAAERAAQSVRMPHFEEVFRVAGTFASASERAGGARKTPLVLLGDAGGTIELFRRLGAAMEEQGLRPSPRIRPHLTLSYCSAGLPWQKIDPVVMPVDGFSLIHSELGLTRYNMIGSWPLLRPGTASAGPREHRAADRFLSAGAAG